ncbi:MAG: TolC family protein [Bacteroidetes bacterium]|nr:TolC family protein [Bacteroidota bacterium]
MNKKLSVLHLFLLPLLLFAQNSFSIEDAVNYGLENNTEFKNVKLDAEIRKEFAFEVMTDGFPKINVNLDYGYAFKQQVSIVPAGIFGPNEQEFIFAQPQSATLKADVQQLIFDARYIYGLKARTALIATADQQIEQARISTTESIVKAYYGALISQQAFELLSQNESVLQKILFETTQTYKAGLTDELSVNRLELNLLNLQSQIQKQKNQSTNALLNLKYILGMPSDEELNLTESFEGLVQDLDLNLSQSIDTENRIELQLLKNQEELKGYDIKQARSAYFPSLYGFAYYGTLAQRPEFNFFDTSQRWFSFGSVGFSLKIPVFDGLKAHSQVQQRKLELEKIVNTKENFEAAMTLQVTNAQNNLANAINDYNTQTENLALANKILNKTIIMFNEGVGSSFELSNSQQAYTNTMINYSQSLYNLLTTKLELNKALGNL